MRHELASHKGCFGLLRDAIRRRSRSKRDEMPSMALYGYARVSSLDQDLTLQEEMLRAAGCQIVRAEKKSGTAREGRSELRLLLDFLHKGDTLVITRIDRLARSVK